MFVFLGPVVEIEGAEDYKNYCSLLMLFEREIYQIIVKLHKRINIFLNILLKRNLRFLISFSFFFYYFTYVVA